MLIMWLQADNKKMGGSLSISVHFYFFVILLDSSVYSILIKLEGIIVLLHFGFDQNARLISSGWKKGNTWSWYIFYWLKFSTEFFSGKFACVLLFFVRWPLYHLISDGAGGSLPFVLSEQRRRADYSWQVLHSSGAPVCLIIPTAA